MRARVRFVECRNKSKAHQLVQIILRLKKIRMTTEVDVKQNVNGDVAPVVKKPYKMEIVWKNVLLFVALHAAMIVGFTYQKKTISLVVGWTVGFMQGE